MRRSVTSAVLLGGALTLGMITSGAAATATAPAAPSAAAYPNSMAEFQALKDKAKGGTVYTPMNVPDWSGLWRRLGDPEKLDASPIVPWLTPKYKAAYDEKRARDAKGLLWDRLSWCLGLLVHGTRVPIIGIQSHRRRQGEIRSPVLDVSVPCRGSRRA